MSASPAKENAARAACDFVKSGMKLGLGTGSTAALFVDALAEKVRGGLDVVGVPTSEATAAQASRLGIRLTTLDETATLDLTIDGADEVDGAFRLIKGGGGALLREKIVAAASAEMLVIADTSKKVETLGAFPLPVEVVPFGLGATEAAVATVLAAADVRAREITIRRGDRGDPFVTDGGHYILDCHLMRIGAPEALSAALLGIPGVVEHGLFLGLASRVILGHENGADILTSNGD